MKYTNNSDSDQLDSNKITLNSTFVKGNKRRNKAERRKQRRREQLIRSFLICFIFIVLAGGIMAYFLLKPSASNDISKQFSKDDAVYGIAPTIFLDTADSFAKNLCVAKDNVNYSGIQITDVSSSALFDLSQNKVLYSDRVYDKLYPASITKVMTALLAIEYGNLDEVVTVSNHAVDLDPDSSVCNLSAGDQITLKQLIYGLMVHSGNDAATAIAEHVGGSVENFVLMMNNRAKEIGATGTHYTNAHGLHEEDHYTTAYDVYLIFNQALKYDLFIEVIGAASYDASFKDASGNTVTRSWQTTNQYFTREAKMPADVTIIGGKTGTTDAAGNCLVLLSKDAYGNSYISIVMNSETKTALYEKTSQLLNQINK